MTQYGELSFRDSLQDSIRELHAPVVQRVLDAVNGAYTSEEPLIAYTEVPTIIISGSDKSATTSVVSEVEQELRFSLTREDDAMSEDGTSDTDVGSDMVFVSSISPSDCSNLPSTMKSLISGFIKHDPENPGGEGNVCVFVLLDINVERLVLKLSFCVCAKVSQRKLPRNTLLRRLLLRLI